MISFLKPLKKILIMNQIKNIIISKKKKNINLFVKDQWKEIQIIKFV